MTEHPRILLDTQGGDRDLGEVVTGGVKAASAHDLDVILAGDRTRIERELSRRAKKRVTILDAPDVVTMEDAPKDVIRNKPESSLVRGVEAVRDGLADAFVSPANTGAVMAASLFKLGRLAEIDRPGIAAIIPTVHGRNVLLIDVGANADCSPQNLKEFAVMGRVYAREILGVDEPRLGLINIGAERSKGNSLALKTFFLLEQLDGFIGNIEGNQILDGGVDVVVCDGFVGNVLLKSYEGGTASTVEFLRRAIERDILARLGSFIILPALKKFKRSLSAARYGGAPLLGVKGAVIVAHGNSDAEAIKNAVRTAGEAVQQSLIAKIERGLERAPASSPVDWERTGVSG